MDYNDNYYYKDNDHNHDKLQQESTTKLSKIQFEDIKIISFDII